jgi:uncharacterized SAM-binding protein YcdF (DUF218 family)
LILFNSFVLLFVALMLWRKRRITIAVASLSLLWLLATGWLTAPLLDWTEHGVQTVEQPLMTGNTALVLIGAGTRREHGAVVPPPDGRARIVRIAELYTSCKKRATRCTVILSGGDPQHHGATEAATYARDALALGIAPADLLLEDQSRTTYENAKFTSSILRSRRDDAVVLVTSSYQMRRALLDFAHFGIQPQPVYANRRIAQTGWLPRPRNLVDAELALHELAGIVQFHLYCALGWF